jgi:3-oxoacyl-[acyl-carrier protein] reductase
MLLPMVESRAALVTGVSRKAGIAAAVARTLAREGWDVACTGFRAYDATEPWGSREEDAPELVAELGELGVRSGFHEDDLGDRGAPRRVLDAAEAAAGSIQAIVVCHTHSGVGGLLEATAEDVDRHLAVNVRGTILLLAEFVRRFRGEPGSGRVVTLTSSLPLAGEIAYAASKGALEWLTISAAAELAQRGITANAVDPGPTDTGWMTASVKAALEAASPTGTVASPVVTPIFYWER